MSRKSVLMCVLSIVMVAYMAVALAVSSHYASMNTLSGVKVEMQGSPSLFVSEADVRRESGLDAATVAGKKRSELDIYALEKSLKASQVLQMANVNVLADGTVKLTVAPMVPVARVFDHSYSPVRSYYINASGKSIDAKLEYHIDVPVLVGHFDSVHTAHRLLPLLDYIAGNKLASSIVATVTQEPDGNITLIPNIVGHTITFGDTSRVAEKFAMLQNFYRYVAPRKGWSTYDNISVKWRGQLVASLRNQDSPPKAEVFEEENSGVLDIQDDDTMTSADKENENETKPQEPAAPQPQNKDKKKQHTS